MKYYKRLQIDKFYQEEWLCIRKLGANIDSGEESTCNKSIYSFGEEIKRVKLGWETQGKKD